jgi:hypothetical protein
LHAGSAFLRSFIEEMKETGFVREALDRSGQTDVAVAPGDAIKPITSI